MACVGWACLCRGGLGGGGLVGFWSRLGRFLPAWLIPVKTNLQVLHLVLNPTPVTCLWLLFAAAMVLLARVWGLGGSSCVGLLGCLAWGLGCPCRVLLFMLLLCLGAVHRVGFWVGFGAAAVVMVVIVVFWVRFGIFALVGSACAIVCDLLGVIVCVCSACDRAAHAWWR